MELLLSVILLTSMDEQYLSCADGRWILEGIAETDLTVAERSGIVMEVLLAMPDNCEHDDYYPSESTR